MQNLIISIIALLILVNSKNVFSDIKSEFLVCKYIESSTERLNCFDTVVKNYESEILPIQASNSFGMESTNQDETVESFLIGEFKTWKKGMKLRLKNGQVWKVLDSRSGYRKMQDPAITISRGFFGSFDAKIEGLNAKAKVKRIK